METLTVDLGDRSYPIYIGEQLLMQTQLLAPHIKGQQVMVVSNNTIAPLYLERLTAALSSYQVDTVVLPDGEKYKDLPHLNLIFDAGADWALGPVDRPGAQELRGQSLSHEVGLGLLSTGMED